MPTVLVSYDISADTTRARAAATIQMWGERIQRSVFICTLDADDLADLTRRLGEIIELRTDAVHIVPLCGTCWDGITVLGQATVAPERLYWAVL
jgi:CRISPR-associated protein Cas2